MAPKEAFFVPLSLHAETRPFLSAFLYVCPEPVLVKRCIFSIKWHHRKKRHALNYQRRRCSTKLFRLVSLSK